MKVGGNIHFAPSDALSHSQMPMHEVCAHKMLKESNVHLNQIYFSDKGYLLSLPPSLSLLHIS